MKVNTGVVQDGGGSVDSITDQSLNQYLLDDSDSNAGPNYISGTDNAIFNFNPYFDFTAAELTLRLDGVADDIVSADQTLIGVMTKDANSQTFFDVDA